MRIETLVQIFSGLLDDDGIEHAWDASAEPVSNGFLPNRYKVPARPLRLLVAEDNDINRLLSEAMLRKLGHVPVMVIDGEKAVEEAASGAYDAILMDLHMPGLDGFQAIRQIRSDEQAAGRANVPVLIVTRRCHEGCKGQGDRSGRCRLSDETAFRGSDFRRIG